MNVNYPHFRSLRSLRSGGLSTSGSADDFSISCLFRTLQYSGLTRHHGTVDNAPCIQDIPICNCSGTDISLPYSKIIFYA